MSEKARKSVSDNEEKLETKIFAFTNYHVNINVCFRSEKDAKNRISALNNTLTYDAAISNSRVCN